MCTSSESRRPYGALTRMAEALNRLTRNLGSLSTSEPSSLKTAYSCISSPLIQINSKECHAGTSMFGGLICISGVGGRVGSTG